MSLPLHALAPEVALPSDLPKLHALEMSLFPEERQESLASLRRSLNSVHQKVWVMREGDDLLGSMTLRCYPKSLRIYSLAVALHQQGRGWGGRLVDQAEACARAMGKTRLRLEADAANTRLIQWYLHRGFLFESVLSDYYGPGTSAQRLSKLL